MDFLTRSSSRAYRSQDVLSTLSELACRICGHHALSENSPHEYAQGLTNRLICLVCGAHRIL